MPKIKKIGDTSALFLYNGLNYNKGIYEIYYSDKQVDTLGDILDDEASVGIRSRDGQEILASPVNFASWINEDTGAPFTSTVSLVSYLGDAVSSVSGGSPLPTGAATEAKQDNSISILSHIKSNLDDIKSLSEDIENHTDNTNEILSSTEDIDTGTFLSTDNVDTTIVNKIDTFLGGSSTHIVEYSIIFHGTGGSFGAIPAFDGRAYNFRTSQNHTLVSSTVITVPTVASSITGLTGVEIVYTVFS